MTPRRLLGASALLVIGLLFTPPPSVAGVQPVDDFFPVHLDPETGEIHLEVTRLDEEFLYLVTYPTGLGSNDIRVDRGQTAGQWVVHFERHGPRVLLVRPNTRFVASSEDPDEVRAVEESFPRSILASLPIMEEEEGRLLVDATDLFLSDMANTLSTLRGGGVSDARLDRDRSVIRADRTGSYPTNTEVRALLSFASDASHPALNRHAPDGRTFTIEQHHTFMQLPDEPLPPRFYDPRTGNSSQVFDDYSQPLDGEYRRRLVARWRLEPSDPEAYLAGELVEPVEPIVFHMDPGIQEPYRTPYMEGILWWNDAFEAAGFRNAVEVRDLPEGADPMDARYSMLQLVHRTGAGPSVGGGRRDPRTGELIQGMPRMDSHRSLTDFNIYAGLLPVYEEQGVEPQLSAEEFAMARRRQHVAHEVGHALGLPHNFIAAAQGRSSVMDYPFPLIELDDEGGLDISRAYRPSVGYADSLAIRYAYTWYPDAQAEAEGLEEIVQEALDRGFLYLTGGHAAQSGSFPEVHQWVEGSTMFEALERTAAVRRILLDHFDERAIRPGEPMAWLNQRLAHVYLHHRYSVEGVVKYVGGAEFRYALRGDGQTPVQPISAAEQRRALEEILQVLSPEALAVPPGIVELIPPTPSGFDAREPWIDSPAGTVLDPLAMARSFAQEVVDNLLHRQRAHRIVSLHHADPDLPSLDEVLEELVEATWGAPGPRSGTEGGYARAAERAVLDGLFTLASDEAATAEVRDIAEHRLALLAQGLGGNPDGPEDEAHRERTRREISRFLNDGTVPPLRTGVIDMPLPWP